MYKSQVDLFRERLQEIEAIIWRTLKIQQGIESRIMVFFDDSLKTVFYFINFILEIRSTDGAIDYALRKEISFRILYSKV